MLKNRENLIFRNCGRAIKLEFNSSVKSIRVSAAENQGNYARGSRHIYEEKWIIYGNKLCTAFMNNFNEYVCTLAFGY